MAKLLYQGHGSFRLRSAAGTVIYIDPFAGTGYDLPADGILVSHEHHDHNAVELVTLKDGGCIRRAADLLHNGRYDQCEIGEVVAAAVPAYNDHHDRDACVGFMVGVDGKVLYFAGDTSTTDSMPAMRLDGIDYAFLPCDGIYNMDVKEASACAETIHAKHSTPVHMAPGALFDEKIAAAFEGPGKLVLHSGEEIEL